MPVKRREIVVRGRDDDLVLHPETIVNHSRTDTDGWRKQAPRVVLLSSGVLYNSSSFFPLSLTRNAATTSTPRFRRPSPLDSTRFQPFATKSERAPASSRRQWVSSGIGNKLCSAELARKITGRPEIRARRAAARKKSCWRSILLDEFFVCGSGNENGTGVPGDLSIPTLPFPSSSKSMEKMRIPFVER